MLRNVFFNEVFRETLRRLFEAGFFASYLEKRLDSYKGKDSANFKIHEKQSEYSTLTLKQLYPGFYVWLVALIACIIVFMGEIIVFKI